jgi:hypothetical protein
MKAYTLKKKHFNPHLITPHFIYNKSCVSVSEHMFLCVRSFNYILDITLWREPKVTRRFHKFKQLNGKGPCLLVRPSPELVPRSFWPIAGYQKVTNAVHLAEIYNGNL